MANTLNGSGRISSAFNGTGSCGVEFDGSSRITVSLRSLHPSKTVEAGGRIGLSGITTASWSPRYAPASGYTGWFKADAGVYSDSGTTPSVNNGVVKQWNNFNNTNNLTQSFNDFYRPIYKTNHRNGLPAIQFTTNQFLNCSAFQDNPCTLVICGYWLDFNQINGRIAGYGQTRSVFSNSSGAGSGWGFYLSDQGGFGTSTVSNAIGVAVYRLETGQDRMMRLNGSNIVTIRPHNDAIHGLGIGCNGSDVSECGDVIVYEVLHYPYILSDVEAQATEAYLNNKYSIY